MSPQELVNQAIAAFNQRDAATYTALFTEDAGIWSSFSDVNWELAGPVLADGEHVAYAVTVQMTHDGPMPMPDGSVVGPTGEKVSFETGVFWTRDNDGLIAEERGYFDATAVALQLGLIG